MNDKEESVRGAAIPRQPSRRQAFGYWLKLGCVSFGGPAGQIAMMHAEVVERRRWISEKRFLHALNYCMLLPGPEAQQLATYIGWLMHGAWGGIVAGALFVLPSLLVLVALSWIYMAWGQAPLVAGALWAVKPAVTAIVAHAAWRIGGRTVKNGFMAALAALAFVALFIFAVPFPAIVLAAGIIGYAGGRLAPSLFKGGGGHAVTGGAQGAALIDDDTPPPAHARFSWRRTIALAASFLALWGAALAALDVVSGGALFTAMGWFFTKAALLTFGGAYAVLPYVYQGAVEHYGWLSGAQMIDGLALGETTPGPLIMVVAFVGFVGAWSQAALGPEALFHAGALGAAVATFFTFLPSFLFILAGGPLVEATHGRLGFTAPLTAISAAVVGVIANLSLFFAWHVLWPRASAAQPFAGGFDWAALLVGLAAALALFRYKRGVIEVVAAAALVGVAVSLV